MIREGIMIFEKVSETKIQQFGISCETGQYSYYPYILPWFYILTQFVCFSRHESSQGASGSSYFQLLGFWICNKTTTKYQTLVIQGPKSRKQHTSRIIPAQYFSSIHSFTIFRNNHAHFSLLYEQFLMFVSAQPGYISIRWNNDNVRIFIYGSPLCYNGWFSTRP